MRSTLAPFHGLGTAAAPELFALDDGRIHCVFARLANMTRCESNRIRG